MMDREIREYIESLGWEITEHKDVISGLPIFHKNIEHGFNTGYNCTLTLHLSKLSEQCNVIISEEIYGSWANSKNENQYFLESIKDLEQLMKFKNITKI